jgi:hypothetical protein
MNLVREHIMFEKFTEDSDPISDMGIGLKELWKKAYLEIKYSYPFEMNKKYFLSYKTYDKKRIYFFGGPLHILYYTLNNLCLGISPQEAFSSVCKLDNNNSIANREIVADVLKTKFYVDVNPIFESINEKFTEDSDPIADMGIGYTPKKIVEDFKQKILKEFPDFLHNNIFDFYFDEKSNFIKLGLDGYTTEGMNNLDNAVKKSYQKIF